MNVNLQGGKYGCALQAAACSGHEEVVQRLLEAGADVNLQGGEYGCALQAAAHCGSNAVVQQLLAAGADVNLQCGKYGCALQAGAWNRHGEVIQQLLAAEADVNLQGGKYGYAVQAAARRGSKEVVQQLLTAGVDVNLEGGRYGDALQATASNGHEEVVQALLAAGADINSHRSEFSSALDAAVTNQQENVVKQLLRAGADPNYGWTFPDAVEKFYEYRDSRARSILNLLIEYSVDALVAGDKGTALLRYAISLKDLELVIILIEAFVARDPTFTQLVGEELWMSTKLGTQITGILIKAGARVNFHIILDSFYHGREISSRLQFNLDDYGKPECCENNSDEISSTLVELRKRLPPALCWIDWDQNDGTHEFASENYFDAVAKTINKLVFLSGALSSYEMDFANSPSEGDNLVDVDDSCSERVDIFNNFNCDVDQYIDSTSSYPAILPAIKLLPTLFTGPTCNTNSCPSCGFKP